VSAKVYAHAGGVLVSASPVLLYGPDNKPLTRRQYTRTNNSLITAATQTSDRKRVPALDYDVHRTVTNLGRRTLMTLGRKLYFDSHAIRAAIKEKAEYASSIYLPQFYGDDQDWGITAEAWLENHDKICDVAGPPYNMRLYRRNLIIAAERDGDMLTVLVKGKTGYPFIQCIPGHRIGSRYEDLTVQKGEYDGARIIDGVIVNDTNTPIAYRVMTGEPEDWTQYIDIPARDCFLSFVPEFQGQLRGFSQLGITALPIMDIAESDNLELITQRVASSIALIERNEEGEAPPGDSEGYPVAAPAAGAMAEEKFTADGVQLRYFRSGDPNAGLEILENNRPSANQQNFRHAKLRDAFAGIDWSIDFSLDPSKVGGAPFRVVVDKLNRNIRAIQDLALEPALLRIDGFRVSSAVQIGALPQNKDWWKWTYQGPARITADAKYESEVDISEVAKGLKTRRRALANRGEYIDDVDKETERDATHKWEAAERVSKRFKVPIETAYNSLWNEQPNGLPPEQPEPKEAAPTE
jgi:hypothetical protein